MIGACNKPSPLKSDRTIVLVGMMGVGKTTVGRRLAPKLGLPFFDADEEIEKASGMSVSDLFAQHGEKSFRRGEAQVIERLISGPPILLATGGGALTTEETRALIAAETISVWLKSDIDTILRRATRRGTRPLLKVDDPRRTLLKLLEEREPLYSVADITVNSQPGPHGKTVTAIIEALGPILSTAPEKRKTK